MSWRVGGIARETGVTIRTLHYYEEIGLLIPSGRSEAGHRLYGASDIRRLHQIRALQQAGFRLAEIRDLFEEEALSPKEEMEKGTDPADGRVQTLVSRWQELVEMFTGGDPGITASVGRIYREEPQIRQKTGLTAEIMAYVAKAQGAASSREADPD